MAGDEDVTFFRHNADRTDIQGTEMDWFYGSQARNIRRLHIGLVFNLPAVATRAATRPAIDGRPDVRFDDNPNLIRFCDREKRIYRPAAAALSYDEDNLYVTLRREAARKDGKLVPWTAETERENALTWKDDSWSTRLEIEFVPHRGSLPPVISGLELIGKYRSEASKQSTLKEHAGFVQVTILDKENKALAESELIAQTVTDGAPADRTCRITASGSSSDSFASLTRLALVD